MRSLADLSGHLRLVDRHSGGQWYVRYRLPDGKQIQRRLGPAWRGRGFSPPGQYTREQAEAQLRAVLNTARRETISSGSTVTFAEAAIEFLRYAENVLQVENSIHNTNHRIN